jgi:hypothetical protein
MMMRVGDEDVISSDQGAEGPFWQAEFEMMGRASTSEDSHHMGWIQPQND